MTSVALWLSLSAGLAAAQAQPPAGLTDVYLASPLRPVFTVAPGDTISAEIVLENRGSEAVTVRLFQHDFRTDEGGEAVYEEPGSGARSNAEWVSLSRPEVRLAPGQRVAVPYEIRVPRLGDLTGSYWSVIMVEPQSADAVEYQDLGDGAQAGVRTLFRYGVTVLTNLGDSGLAQLDFGEPQFLYGSDTETYTFSLRMGNPGERLLTPRVWLELYDMAGNQIGRFEGVRDRIFPGSFVRQSFDLGPLEAGDYRAVLIADAGGDEIFGVRYTLNVATNTP